MPSLDAPGHTLSPAPLPPFAVLASVAQPLTGAPAALDERTSREEPLALVGLTSAAIAGAALQAMHQALSPASSAWCQQALVTTAAVAGPVALASVRPASRQRMAAVANLSFVFGPLLGAASRRAIIDAPLLHNTPATLALSLAAQTCRRMASRQARWQKAVGLRQALRLSLPVQWLGALSLLFAQMQRSQQLQPQDTSRAPMCIAQAAGGLVVAATLSAMLVDGTRGAGRRAHRGVTTHLAFAFTASMVVIAAAQGLQAASALRDPSPVA